MAHLIFHAGSAGKATRANAKGMLRHTQRKKLKSHNHSNEDIDVEKTKYNMDFMKKSHNQKGMSAYDVIEERLENEYQGKRRLRKDQVVLREVITQPSAEMFEGMTMQEKSDLMRKFVLDSTPWFNDEFGADNVLGTSVHLDETNPHAHVMIMPMTDDGRISQTEFFTGPKDLQRQHADYRQHMIDRGWDFEKENKYEKIDNHEMPSFKANGKQIQSIRESQTKEIRNMSQDTDIREEALKMAYNDVHEVVLRQERERLEKEQEEMQEYQKQAFGYFEAVVGNSTAQYDLNKLEGVRKDGLESITPREYGSLIRYGILDAVKNENTKKLIDDANRVELIDEGISKGEIVITEPKQTQRNVPEDDGMEF